MLHYPKIRGTRDCPSGRCTAFEKYDGANLHFSWNGSSGWYEFGTRRDSVDLIAEGVSQFSVAHPLMERAADVFEQTLGQGLAAVLSGSDEYSSCGSVKVFAEYLAVNSFTGTTSGEGTGKQELVLFDVQLEGWGLIGPEQFIRDFGHLNSARVVYRGRLTGTFAEDVRRGRYGVDEGVVCKGGRGGSDLWMAKIKTYAYLQRLKAAVAGPWAPDSE